jgi:hypothetical protein
MIPKPSFFRTLCSEILSIPFLAIAFIIAISFRYDFWLMYNGAASHLYLFLTGQGNSISDFMQYASVFVSEVLSLTYLNFGGTSFKVSAFLYNFGHTHHVIYPFFLLVYLKWKRPELSSWIQSSMYFYAFSLIFYRSFMLYYHISELHIAHTLTWILLFLFQSTQEAQPDNKKMILNSLWITSLLSLFTYPIHLFTHLFILTRLFLLKNNIRLQIFYGLLILTSLACFLYYTHLISNSYPIFYIAFRNLPMNNTLHFGLAAISLIFILNTSLFPLTFVVASGVAFLYLTGTYFSPWHFYAGRIFAIIIVIILQGLYFFVLPRFGSEAFLKFFKPRFLASLTYIFIVMLYHCHKLDTIQNKVFSMLTSSSRNIPFSDVGYHIHENFRVNSGGWSSVAYSMSLQMLKNKPVLSVIENAQGRAEIHLIDSWGQEKFFKELDKRNIEHTLNLRFFPNPMVK